MSVIFCITLLRLLLLFLLYFSFDYFCVDMVVEPLFNLDTQKKLSIVWQSCVCLKNVMKFFIKLWCVYFFSVCCDYFFFSHSLVKFTCELSTNFVSCDLPATVNAILSCSIHKFWELKWNWYECRHFSILRWTKFVSEKK